MTSLQRIRGTRDMMPEDNRWYRFIEETAWKLAQRFGYEEIETPLFESSEVFHRTLGETSDVIHKETYTFLDRGGDSITLRPEGTAGIARAFISEGLAQNLPLKFYYSGAMFRYERPQKGRYRQFQQIGVETLGLENPLSDVDVILLGWELLQELKLSSRCEIQVNTLGDQESRNHFREALVNYFSKYKNDLSPDSQIRLEKNPLRILDSKSPSDRKLIVDAPKLSDHLNATSKAFFDQVQEGILKVGIPMKLSHELVRGLDYYCHTVFEFVTTELGAQGTVLAGGRYDGLIQTMGGPRTPGVGWAAGVDRLMDLLDKNIVPQSAQPIVIVPADLVGEKEALVVATILRKKGHIVEIIWTGNVGKKMKKANSMNASFVFVIGESEVKSQTLAQKNMKTGEQKNIKIQDLATFDLT